jgi:hypothetical protein
MAVADLIILLHFALQPHAFRQSSQLRCVIPAVECGVRLAIELNFFPMRSLRVKIRDNLFVSVSRRFLAHFFKLPKSAARAPRYRSIGCCLDPTT